MTGRLSGSFRERADGQIFVDETEIRGGETGFFEEGFEFGPEERGSAGDDDASGGHELSAEDYTGSWEMERKVRGAPGGTLIGTETVPGRLKSVLLRDAGGSPRRTGGGKTDEMKSNAGHGVRAGKEHQRDFRKLPDDGAHQDKENDKQRRLLLRPGNVLETVVADRASHERGERGGQQKPCDRPAPVVQGNFEAVNDRGDNAGCRRRGHPHEKL